MAELKIIGRQPLLEAFAAKLPVKRVYLLPNMQGESLRKIEAWIERRRVPVTYLKRSDLEKLAGEPGHQGVVALVAMPRALSLPELLALMESRPHKALALLDGIEDPRNLGAILRSANAAGIGGIVLPARRSVSLTPAAVKTSAGAALHTPVVTVTNLARAMEEMKGNGYWFVGADMQGKKTPWEIDLTMPVGFVLGREGKGLHRLVREKCDFLVSLPMRGDVESLNVSAAATVLFYEWVRQVEGK